MPKLILLLFFGIMVFFLLRSLQGKGAGHKGKTGPPSEPERMVACAHCGVHIPESESLASLGSHYCSEEHRRLGPA